MRMKRQYDDDEEMVDHDEETLGEDGVDGR